MNPTLPTRIGLLGLTLLTLATGVALVSALPSYLAAWPGSDRVVPSVLAIFPLAAAVFFGFALVRPRSINPILLMVAGGVLIFTGLFGLTPIIEFKTFPYANDWASVLFNYGAIADIVAGIWAIAEGALCLRSRTYNAPGTPYHTT